MQDHQNGRGSALPFFLLGREADFDGMISMLCFMPKKILTLLALLVVMAAQGSRPLPFGPWHRLSSSPVIAPRGNGWEAAGTFNPAV